MTVRIRTSDGSAFVVDGSFHDLHQKVVDALMAHEPFIEVRNDEGLMRSINTKQITSLEEIGPETSARSKPADEQRDSRHLYRQPFIDPGDAM